jgi:PAS domain S-box-containing protein
VHPLIDGVARAWDDLELGVLEASPNAIVAVDGSGRITYCNPQAETTFGYARDELIGQAVELLLPEGVAALHVEHRTDFVADPRPRPIGIGMEVAARRRDGTEFPCEVSLAPVKTPEGLRIFATLVDITARKEAVAALAESERRFRTVLEASPNAIVGVDQNGTIAYANPGVEIAFGYSPGEVIGQPLQILLPERVHAKHGANRERYMKKPVVRPMGIGLDLTGRRKDGTEFPVEIGLSPVKTADGMQVFAAVVDITARKAAEAQVLQAQKLESIGRLAGGVAHDFNNILFAINGYAELVGQDLAGKPPADLTEVRESVAAIRQAADRGANLTTQLLTFGRQQIVIQKVVDAAQGIHALEPMLRRLIGENIDLQVRVEKPGRLRIDPGQLDQIVVNLVVNARDAMPGGGALKIEVGSAVFEEAYAMEHFEVSPGSYVMISVSDTGEGMDRATREHIFEPFFTTKDRGRGTGLGLATIYGIVSQSGGHIWVYSEPGHGSTFKLYFPMVDEAPTPPVRRPIKVPTRSTGRILLVEDEPAVRDMTRRILERAGYTVTVVQDGAAAITAVEAGATIDVLVTDVVMPNMSGIELAEWMLDRHAETGVVLLSGYTVETLDLQRLLGRGARFMSKPVTSGEMLRAIHEARGAMRPEA